MREGPQNTPGISEKHAHSDIRVIIGNAKRELSRNKGQVPWPYSRPQPNWQELSRRQGILPRKGVW